MYLQLELSSCYSNAFPENQLTRGGIQGNDLLYSTPQSFGNLNWTLSFYQEYLNYFHSFSPLNTPEWHDKDIGNIKKHLKT